MINNLFEPGQLTEDRARVGEADRDLLEDPVAEEPEISGPKLYLLKLVEFNKIALLEKVGFGAKPSQQNNFQITAFCDFLEDDAKL